MNQTAYDNAVNEMKEVASGSRGWVSLTRQSKLSGVSKEQLSVVAKSLKLSIGNHGKYGLTASKSS